MDHCIYHSRDLDGLTSGAVILAHQKGFGDDCKLYGYDYGEKLDTRKFKGKTTVMIDVSMPMDRMETLGKGCMQFIWIDHHLSAYDNLLNYCVEKGYDIIRTQVNGLIESIEVKSMNMIYYYSSKISACEMAAMMYAKNLKEGSRKLVSLLGQYDTWRNTSDKKFTTDEDWEEMVLPIQWGMRRCSSPEDVYDILLSLDEGLNGINIYDVLGTGRLILAYQKNVYKTICSKNGFEFEFQFEGESYGVIALNASGFNSMSFS